MGDGLVLESPANLKSKIAELNRKISDIDERLSEVYREGAGSTLLELKATEKLRIEVRKSLSTLKEKLERIDDSKGDRETLLGMQKSVDRLEKKLGSIGDAKDGMDRAVREIREAKDDLDGRIRSFRKEIDSDSNEFKLMNKRLRTAVDEAERKIRGMERFPKEMEQLLEKQDYNFREKVEFINSAINGLNKKLFDAAADFDNRFARKEEIDGVSKNLNEVKECIGSLGKNLEITKALAEEVRENKRRTEEAKAAIGSLANWSTAVQDNISATIKGVERNHEIVSKLADRFEQFKPADHSKDILLLKERLEGLDGKMSGIKLPDHSKDIEMLRERLRELDGRVYGMKLPDSSDDIKELEKKIAAIDGRLTPARDHSGDIEEIRKKVREIENLFFSFSVPNHTDDINALKEKMKGLENSKMPDNSDGVYNIEKKIGELEKVLSNIETGAITSFEDIRKEHEERSKALNQEMETNKEFLKNFHARLSQSEVGMVRAEESLKQEMETNKEFLKNFHARLSQSEVGVVRAEEALGNIEKIIGRIENGLSDKTDMDGLKKELSGKIVELEDRMIELSGVSAEFGKRLDGFDDEMPDLPDDLIRKPEFEEFELRMKFDAAKQTEDRLADEKAKLEQQISGLKKRMDELNYKIDAPDFEPLNRKMDDVKERLQSEMASIKDNISIMESRNQVMFSEVRRLSEKPDGSERIAALHNKVEDIGFEKGILERKLADISEKVSKKADVDNVSSAIGNISKEMEGKIPTDFVTKRDVEVALAETASSMSHSNQFEDIEKRLSGMEKSMAEFAMMGQSIDSLRGTVNTLSKHIAEMPKNLTFGDELQPVKDGLTQLSAIQEQMTNIQHEIASLKAKVKETDAHWRIDGIEEQLANIKTGGNEPLRDIIKALDDKLYKMQKKTDYDSG